MMFWVLAALMAAIVTSVVTAPLYPAHRRLAMALFVIIPLFALGIYLSCGNPDLTSFRG